MLNIPGDPYEFLPLRDFTENYTLSAEEILEKIDEKVSSQGMIQKYKGTLSLLLDTALDGVKKLDNGEWVILDRSLNVTWSEIRETRRIYTNIGLTFALMFILLGVLVCYATIGKIIEDQRILVGTTKALGFRKREIFTKYMFFGVTATILGVLVGILLAYYLIQSIMLNTMSQLFVIGGYTNAFQPVPSLLAVIIGIVISVFAVIMGCRRLLEQPARVLLSGEIPATFISKRAGKSGTSLYTDLIMRNIRVDIKRVLVTVASIAGCCVLLVIGFSLKQSFIEILDHQFGDILRFDAIMTMQQDSGDVVKETDSLLNEARASYIQIYLINTVLKNGNSKEAVQLICASPEDADSYFHFRDPETMTDTGIPSEGIMIFGQLAEKYNINIGDRINIMDGDGHMYEVPVTRIYNNYAGRYVFMSSEYAEKIFSEKIMTNTLLISFDKNASEELSAEKMSAITGVLNYMDMDEMRERYKTTSKLMDLVILLTTVMAAIMAAVVILNLIRIQLNQKKRELTIMRVNGFSTHETVLYILRENIITTGAGILIGLLLGILASNFTLSVIDRVELRMYRSFMFEPLLYSVLVTLLFAAIVNFFALRKIRTLKLSDVND